MRSLRSCRGLPRLGQDVDDPSAVSSVEIRYGQTVSDKGGVLILDERRGTGLPMGIGLVGTGLSSQYRRGEGWQLGDFVGFWIVVMTGSPRTSASRYTAL